MYYNYNLTERGTYFKMVITSTNGDGLETYIAMYDFPIKQSYVRGIYVNDNEMITQRGLVFLCAFPGKTINIMETTTTLNPDGEPTENPNLFYVNGEQMTMYGFFEYLIGATGR
jgi:hypothetical protein